MAELATFARPYAKAAFDFAQEANHVGAWSNVLGLSGAIMQDTAFAAYLSQPSLTQKQQVQALATAMDNKINAQFRNFLTQLAEHHRLSLLPEIFVEFEQLRAKGLGETDAVIESAFPLSQSQELLLTTQLEKRLGTKINLTVTIRPELIGGVIIRAGDQVIDDSALGKLEKMRTRLLA
jgi:F-type H+-transporting ATPase subunit delta